MYVVLCQQLVLTSRNDHQKKRSRKKTNRELYACEHKNVVFISHLEFSNKVKKGCKKYVYLPWINSWSLIDFFYRWLSVNKRKTDFNMRKRNIQLVHSVHKFSLCEWVRETRKKSTTTTTEQQPQSGHTDGGDNSKEKHSRNDWTSVRSN